jgi:hypothetical protein
MLVAAVLLAVNCTVDEELQGLDVAGVTEIVALAIVHAVVPWAVKVGNMAEAVEERTAWPDCDHTVEPWDAHHLALSRTAWTPIIGSQFAV